jgi:predicted DNA-binding transcriptional regulator AlpA
MEQREFDGMPRAGVIKLRKGSAAWYRAEMDRFKALSREHHGLTTPAFAGIILGVSRQRVYKLMYDGRLTTHEIMGKMWLQVDEVEAFAELDRDCGTRYAVA